VATRRLDDEHVATATDTAGDATRKLDGFLLERPAGPPAGRPAGWLAASVSAAEVDGMLYVFQLRSHQQITSAQQAVSPCT